MPNLVMWMNEYASKRLHRLIIAAAAIQFARIDLAPKVCAFLSGLGITPLRLSPWATHFGGRGR